MYGSGHGNRDQQLYNPHGFIEIVNEIERYDVDYPAHSERSYSTSERGYSHSDRENHYRFCGEEDSYTAGHEQYLMGGEQYSMFGHTAMYENLENHSQEYRTGENCFFSIYCLLRSLCGFLYPYTVL